jgi:hypothetical protein
MSKNKRKPKREQRPEPIAEPPEGATVTINPAPLTKENLIMGLTTKLPDNYDDLEAAKKVKVENVLVNLHNGMTLTDACNNASLSHITFYRYRQRFAWLEDAYNVVLEARTQVVEDKLFVSCTGYDYKTTVRKVARQGEGEDARTTTNVEEKMTHVPPNPSAIMF